jgi:hypothetical protein
MRWLAIGVLLALVPLPAADCPGSVAIGDIQLRAEPPRGGPALPIRRVHNLPFASKILYQPIRLPADARKDARVTIVLVGAADAAGQVTVLDPKPASGDAEWVTPFPAGVVAFILGPQGLDEKRVANLVTKDENLVSHLADFAEQTADLEAAVQSLAALEFEEPSDEEEPAPDRSTPAERALLALVRALNPVVAANNPLGAGRRMAPVTLRGRAAVGFFENAGGVIPGGGALSEVRNWLFPDTEFRATFGQPAAQGFTLCAQRQGRTRNRLVYLWAYRVLNMGPPPLALARETHLALGSRMTAPVKGATASQWAVVDRIQDWNLTPKSGGPPVPVPVQPSLQRRALSIDLTGFSGPPGVYRLAGQWDWSKAEVAGDLHLDPPGDLTAVRLSGESIARLVEGNGPVVARLEGTDFQFVDRVRLKRTAGRDANPLDLQVAPPLGRRASPQPFLELELDTNFFRSGAYALLLAQAGGPPQEVPLRVAPPHPRLDNLPLRVNMGGSQHTVSLRGIGLDRIERIESDQAEVRLEGGAATEREATVQLRPSVKKGDLIAISLRVRDVAAPVPVPDAILALGPRPRITAAQRAAPPDLGVALRPGELPAGSYAGFSLRTENLDGPVTLSVQCAGRGKAVTPRFLRPDELFVSFDPGDAGPSGCELAAVVETDGSGASEPYPLGRVIRMPRIESFIMTEEKLADGVYAGLLRGQDLETIERTGWTASAGEPVPGLPTSAGSGATQVLKIAMPWPSPAPRSPLYVWLRQESEGRATTARY